MKKFIFAIILLFTIGVAYVALTTTDGGNQQAALDKQLKEIGTEFYEDFYFDQIVTGKTDEEITQFLNRFEEIGIKVDLDNLSRFNQEKYGNISESFINKKDNIPCDIHNTRAVIYPLAPYGKTDHKIETELDCGFQETENN